MIEFIKTYWHFFVAGAILGALIAYWVYEMVRSKRAKERELDAMEAELAKIEGKEEAKQEKAEEVKKSAGYTVSYDDEKKDWVVRKDGSSRATRRTKTEQEALDVVKKLTEN